MHATGLLVLFPATAAKHARRGKMGKRVNAESPECGISLELVDIAGVVIYFS